MCSECITKCEQIEPENYERGGGPCINDFDRHPIFFRALDF